MATSPKATFRSRVAPTGPVPARETTIWISGSPAMPGTSEGRPLRRLSSAAAPRNEPSGAKNSRLKSVVTRDGDSTSRASTVKSPVSPPKPVIVIV